MSCVMSVRYSINSMDPFGFICTIVWAMARGSTFPLLIFIHCGWTLYSINARCGHICFTPSKKFSMSSWYLLLLFVDDTLLFFKDSSYHACQIKDILDNFAVATGHFINPSKCSIMFGEYCPLEVRG